MQNQRKPLAGKTALVTGASRGIGHAVANRLADLGSDVAISARDAKQLEFVAVELRKHGVRVFSLAADLTQSSSAASVVEQAEKSLGPLDILVNNAGVGWFKPIPDFSEADWDAILDTNLKAVFLLTQAAAPGMIGRRTGHIINIASLAGKNAFAGGSVYCASKWGLLGFTQCAAEDLRPYGIRVSAICPGTVATDFSPHAGKDPAKMLQSEDIAHAVEMIVTQARQSFISEVLLRPTQKP
jgi:3-oxoacyl-[acyl-carrier protein] reductase